MVTKDCVFSFAVWVDPAYEPTDVGELARTAVAGTDGVIGVVSMSVVELQE